MKYQIRRTSQFKKDYKRAIKRGLVTLELDRAVELLAKDGFLPPEYNDHPLAGDNKGLRRVRFFSAFGLSSSVRISQHFARRLCGGHTLCSIAPPLRDQPLRWVARGLSRISHSHLGAVSYFEDKHFHEILPY